MMCGCVNTQLNTTKAHDWPQNVLGKVCGAMVAAGQLSEERARLI